jgi:hypothetical protein
VSITRPKAPWDKRAWTIGGLGAVVVAGIASLPFPDDSRSENEICLWMVLVSTVILPPILAGISLRRWFLWAYLPQAGLFLGIIDRSLIMSGASTGGSGSGYTETTSAQDAIIGSIVMFLGPMMFALPVVTTRCLLARNKRRTTMLLVANNESPDLTNTWPPPPSNPQ